MQKHKIIFFTGAGISVDSGIPTFQEQPGIRDRLDRSFARRHPEEYLNTIRTMLDSCENAKPNAAHVAIAELGCPVITMNVDKLHRKAGSKDVLEIHGVLPTREELEHKHFPEEYRGIVLYGDSAPRYQDAISMVKHLEFGESVFVVVGVSFYTAISDVLVDHARRRGAEVIIINDSASTKVPELCEILRRDYWKE